MGTVRWKPKEWSEPCVDNHACVTTFTNVLWKIDNPFYKLMNIDELVSPSQVNIYGNLMFLSRNFHLIRTRTRNSQQHSDVVVKLLYNMKLLNICINVIAVDTANIKHLHVMSTKHTDWYSTMRCYKHIVNNINAQINIRQMATEKIMSSPTL